MRVVIFIKPEYSSQILVRTRVVFYPRFFDEQLSSAVGAIDFVRGNENGLLTPSPAQIHGIDFCDCLASTLGRITWRRWRRLA